MPPTHSFSFVIFILSTYQLPPTLLSLFHVLHIPLALFGIQLYLSAVPLFIMCFVANCIALILDNDNDNKGRLTLESKKKEGKGNGYVRQTEEKGNGGKKWKV